MRSRPAVPSPKPSPATLMVSSNATITAPASTHAALTLSSGNYSQQAVTFSSALSGMSQEVTISSNRSGVSQAAAGSGAGWASQAVTISSTRSGVSQAAAGSGAGWASQASSSSQRLF